MAAAPYEYQPDIPPDDHDAQYPYQEFYGGGNRKPRRHGGGHGGWWVLVVLAVVMAGLIGVFSRYSIDVRQTNGGLTLSIQHAEEPAQAELLSPGEETAEPDTVILKPSADGNGGGAELVLSEAPDLMPPTQTAGGQGLSLQQIYKKVIPSVVSITSTLRSGSSTGTGIIMSEDGYIITNDHVIESAVAIEVLTSDDRVYSASLVGSDATSDLAVLKVEATELAAAEFGSSEDMEVGDSVVAIGDPLGKELRGTMTDGIISAINRDLVVNGRGMTLMQTNAALNNGNSGGPLINAYGQVIGINTMKMSSYYSTASVEGLGFAIPISTAKPIIDELILQGYVSGRPAIGISGRKLPEAVQAYYRLPDGIYVEAVDPASDAFQKGIQAGDTITAIEGVPVETMDDLNVVKNQFQAGETVNLTIYRSGELYSVEVVLVDAASL